MNKIVSSFPFVLCSDTNSRILKKWWYGVGYQEKKNNFGFLLGMHKSFHNNNVQNGLLLPLLPNVQCTVEMGTRIKHEVTNIEMLDLQQTYCCNNQLVLKAIDVKDSKGLSFKLLRNLYLLQFSCDLPRLSKTYTQKTTKWGHEKTAWKD